MHLPFTTRLTGVSYGDHQENIHMFGNPDFGPYFLIHEHDNPHDPNAVRVSLLGQFNLGYLPKSIASLVAPMLDSGRQLGAEFVSLNRHPMHDLIGLTVRIIEF